MNIFKDFTDTFVLSLRTFLLMVGKYLQKQVTNWRAIPLEQRNFYNSARNL